MIHSRGIILLALLLTGSLLATGCITQSSVPDPHAGNMNESTTVVLPVITPSALVIPAPAHCTNESNISSTPPHGESIIRIDPVPHHYIGDNITFGGTTNLMQGENLTVLISVAYAHCSKCQRTNYDSIEACCAGLERHVAVRPGDCGMNTWSWDVNTSQYGFQPDSYMFEVWGRDGFVDNTSFFTLSGIPKSNITLNIPENDPNEYAIRFSGQVNTGNGPSENLLLAVSSDSGKKASYTVPIYRNGTGFFWNFTLKKTAITPYNFLSVNVSSATSPEIRIYRTFLYDNEPAYYPYNPYSG